eukprot:2748109-Alexandrium_andersonii.AAC.1
MCIRDRVQQARCRPKQLRLRLRPGRRTGSGPVGRSVQKRSRRGGVARLAEATLVTTGARAAARAQPS